jgi:L-lactate dehydrogenase complex protein LldE
VALELLERLDCSVELPFDQICCGQPMVYTGYQKDAAATKKLFVEDFSVYDFIICPPGSCAHQRYFVDIDLDSIPFI